VFTEPVELAGVNGVAAVVAYGAEDFTVKFLDEPFLLRIEGGLVTAAPGAPPDFDAILAMIAEGEGRVLVRELGFGLNRALTATRRLNDISAYERMCGVHLSLGAKHAIYPKAGLSKRQTRYHVDVFVETERVEIDDAVVYRGGAWSA
jgi:leucyl aminopeptidase (aminopeptidase T)